MRTDSLLNGFALLLNSGCPTCKESIYPHLLECAASFALPTHVSACHRGPPLLLYGDAYAIM